MSEEQYLFTAVIGLDLSPGEYTGLNLLLEGTRANVRLGPNVGAGDRIIGIGSGIYMTRENRNEINDRFDSDIEVNKAIIKAGRLSLGIPPRS